MRIHKLLLSVLVITFLFAFGCGGDDDGGPSGRLDPADSIVEVSFNSQARIIQTAATRALIQDAINISIPAGTMDDQPFVSMTLSIVNFQGVGNYPFGLDNVSFDGTTRAAAAAVIGDVRGTMYDGARTTREFPDAPAGIGMLRVTEITDFTIRGTFNFEAHDGHRDGNLDYILDNTLTASSGSLHLNLIN